MMGGGEPLLPPSRKAKPRSVFGYWQLGMEKCHAECEANIALLKSCCMPIHSLSASLLRPTWSECVPLNGETGSVDSVRTLPW